MEKKAKAEVVATPKFKVKKLVTLPYLKMTEGNTYLLKFLTPLSLAKVLKNAPKDADGKDKKPPHIANCVDLETGELVQIIGGASLCGIMEDEYPNNAYVGKCFQIEPGKKRTAKNGNNFTPYTVAEIEIEDEALPPVADTTKKAK